MMVDLASRPREGFRFWFIKLLCFHQDGGAAATS
jgi:hypothetical protein